MKRILILVAVVGCLVSLMGCVSAPAGLAASTTPVVPGSYKVLGHATGSSSYFSLLSIFPFGHPDYDGAIQNAVQKFNGNALVNVRSYSTLTFLYVVSITSLTVEGDVILQ